MFHRWRWHGVIGGGHLATKPTQLGAYIPYPANPKCELKGENVLGSQHLVDRYGGDKKNVRVGANQRSTNDYEFCLWSLPTPERHPLNKKVESTSFVASGVVAASAGRFAVLTGCLSCLQTAITSKAFRAEKLALQTELERAREVEAAMRDEADVHTVQLEALLAVKRALAAEVSKHSSNTGVVLRERRLHVAVCITFFLKENQEIKSGTSPE